MAGLLLGWLEGGNAIYSRTQDSRAEYAMLLLWKPAYLASSGSPLAANGFFCRPRQAVRPPR